MHVWLTALLRSPRGVLCDPGVLVQQRCFERCSSLHTYVCPQEIIFSLFNQGENLHAVLMQLNIEI